jgi:TetR/AcrR family transcriptional regulator, regulator of cefoperazone and chloramphenicol sensitivity
MEKLMDATSRQKILETTVKLLFTEKPEEITVRRIAADSGVNVAAINYHFRSKDELLNQTIEGATETAFRKGMSVLAGGGKEPVKRLREFLFGYSLGLMNFPALTRSAFQSLFLNDSLECTYGRYMKEMLEAIAKVIGESGGISDPGSLSKKALEILSGVIFPFLVSGTLKEAGSIDYGNKEEREKYINGLLDRITGRK